MRAGGLMALLERLARATREGPVCVIVRTDWVHRQIVERLAGHLFVFHSVTPWVTKGLQDSGVAPELIFELPNGVTGEPFREARLRRCPLRDEYRIPQDAFVILSVGAFDHEVKNFPYVLREIAPLAADPNVYWVVAGSRGNEPTAWEREAQEIFGERFRPLVGVSFERMPDLYGLADLAVCGSLAETFGLVYAETQLSGLPFVMHDYEVTRWMTAGLPAELEGVSRVNMKAPGALSAAIAQWFLRCCAMPRGARRSRQFSKAFAPGKRRAFRGRSLGPRFAETFRRVASPEAAQDRLRSYIRRVAAGTHAQGVQLAQAGKTSEALPYLSAALRAEETSERWNDWATCQAGCERHSEAEQAYQRAIEIDPQNAEALANLAVLLVNQKRHQDAIPLLERAIAIPGRQTAATAAGLARAVQKSFRPDSGAGTRAASCGRRTRCARTARSAGERTAARPRDARNAAANGLRRRGCPHHANYVRVAQPGTLRDVRRAAWHAPRTLRAPTQSGRCHGLRE